MSGVVVTGADRDMAESCWFLCGTLDGMVEAFARHRIAATTAQLDALREAREALEPFTKLLKYVLPDTPHNQYAFCDGLTEVKITVGEMRAAQAALATLEAAIARAEGA
jgi:hypothetical protein